jgi:hypothetical protein
MDVFLKFLFSVVINAKEVAAEAGGYLLQVEDGELIGGGHWHYPFIPPRVSAPHGWQTSG